MNAKNLTQSNFASGGLAYWAPCFAMTLLSFISLMDRSILGILSPFILGDLHLSATQYGTALLVFSICYMLAR